MSVSAVNIEALASLLQNVKSAPDALRLAQETVTKWLDTSPIVTTGLADVPEQASWLDDQSWTLKNQLGYARWLEASTPGVQGTVKFEQSQLANLDYDTAKPLAEKALALMKDGPPPPPELLAMMRKYGGNPTFALLVFHGYREGDGAAGMDLPPSPDLRYLKELGKGPGSEEFLHLYSQMLGGLSAEFPPGKLRSSDPADYRAWALLASRGNWDASWLTQLGNDIIRAERDNPDMWTQQLFPKGNNVFGDVESVLTPEGIEMKDPMVWLMDALSRNPEAAKNLFNGGGDAPVKSDGETVDIGANLRWLTLERPWLQDGGLSLALGLAAAKASGDPDFAHDLGALEHLDPKEKEHWYSFLGHLGLDIIGLVPELGDWADGINIAWYVAEGNYVDAGVAGAAAIPVFGSTATIAKWIERLKKAADATGKVLDAKELKELIEDIPFTDQDPGSVPGADGHPQPKPVPAGATYLADRPDGSHWYDDQKGLQKTQTYVVGDGAVVFETDAHGKISEVRGDTAALTPDEKAWLDRHRVKD